MIDYDTMEAGREMDVLVAERVMELKVEKFLANIGSRLLCRSTNSSGKTQPIPSYSTDITPPMEVVEKLKARGWMIELSNLSDGWLAMLHHIAAEEPHIDVGKAPGISLAICRAALKAVENTYD